MVKNYEPVMSGFAYPLFLRVNHFVVAAAVEAGGMTWRIYKGGIVKRGCGNVPDHAVAIVGYGKEPNGQEHFIVKNSWGTTWGENGYIRIAPDQCGITLGALNVDVPKK